VAAQPDSINTSQGHMKIKQPNYSSTYTPNKDINALQILLRHYAIEKNHLPSSVCKFFFKLTKHLTS